MAPQAEKTGIAVGLNKGHIVHRRELPPRPSRRKGYLSQKTKAVRSLIKEVCGTAPYEKRIIELLRNNKDKRARKLAKKRLGTLLRAKRKVEELQTSIAEARRAGGH